MRVFILIPAYNEAPVIGGVIAGLLPLKHSVVVIDDGSTDATAQTARAAGATVLSQPKNTGQGAALQAGFDYALQQGADVAVTFDADGQHAPGDIAALLKAMDEQKADIVLGSRFTGSAPGISLWRKWLLRVAVVYTNASTGLRLTDTHNGLRALNAHALRCIRLRQHRMAHASEILQQAAKHKLRYAEVPVTITYTPYSVAKGQKLFHVFRILADHLRGSRR